MSEPGPVTCVVATHHRPALLAGTLRHLGPALRAGDELLVVASGDGTAEAAVAADVGVDATVLTTTAPGKSVKLNAGIAAAVNELVVLTDDDVEVDPSWVTGLAAALGDDPGSGIAFGPVRGLTGLGGVAADLPAGPAPIETWAYAHGASMAVRRSCAVDVGGFDERLGPGAPAHGEEHDLVLRAVERGWGVVVAAVAPVRHVAWRSEPEELANLLVYERGNGALVGAALRRRPAGRLKYAVLLGRHEWASWRSVGPDGRRFGRRAAPAFVGGLAYGLRLAPRRHL